MAPKSPHDYSIAIRATQWKLRRRDMQKGISCSSRHYFYNIIIHWFSIGLSRQWYSSWSSHFKSDATRLLLFLTVQKQWNFKVKLGHFEFQNWPLRPAQKHTSVKIRELKPRIIFKFKISYVAHVSTAMMQYFSTSRSFYTSWKY